MTNGTRSEYNIESAAAERRIRRGVTWDARYELRASRSVVVSLSLTPRSGI